MGDSSKIAVLYINGERFKGSILSIDFKKDYFYVTLPHSINNEKNVMKFSYDEAEVKIEHVRGVRDTDLKNTNVETSLVIENLKQYHNSEKEDRDNG